MNINLLNYIDQARKAGMNDEEIRQGLLQSGWQANYVNEAMMSVPMTTSPQQPRPKAMMSKTLAVIFTVIAIAVGGYFGGAYYMANFQSFPLWPFEVGVPVTTFTPRPQVSPSTGSGQFEVPSNWQTYRNEEYGFEFKYPGDFNKIDSSAIPYLDNNHGHILLSIIDGELNPNNIQDLYGRVNLDNIKPIFIGNQEGYSYNSGDGPCGSYTVRTKLSNIKHLMIRFASCIDTGEDDDIEPLLMENKDLINQILSTFRFTR